MSTNIFVNIPTTDLERAKGFYEALGYTINPMFTDENAACVVLDEQIYFMVLTRQFFETFTDKPIVDPAAQVQVAISLTCDSREAVDAMIERGIAAGGREPRPAQDLGFMYTRDLDDPDGNALGYLYMEPAAVEQGPEVWAATQSADTTASV